MKRVIIASKTDAFIYVLLRNGDPIAKGSYEAMSKKSIDMAVPTDIKKFSKSKFNSYLKMAKDARRPNPLKFAVNRYINDNRDEFREINSATNIEDDSIYNLAARLVKFMQNYDWFDYFDSLEIDETEEDVIESTALSLSDSKYIQSILDTLKYILSEEPEVDEATINGLIKDVSKLLTINASSSSVFASSETNRNGINNRWELLSLALDIPNIKYKFNGYGKYEDDDFSINKEEHWCGWWNECFCFVNIWPKSDYGKKKLLEVKDVFSEHGYTFNTKLVCGGLGINFKTMTEEESNKKAESNLLHGGRMSD